MRNQLRRKMTCLFVVLMMGPTAVACSSDTTEPNENPPEEPQSGLVEIRLIDGNLFSPAEVTITPGTTVRWITESTADHTITPRNDQQEGVWTRQFVPNDADPFEHTFAEAGQVYDYFCEPHEDQGMEGKITVVEE